MGIEYGPNELRWQWSNGAWHFYFQGIYVGYYPGSYWQIGNPFGTGNADGVDIGGYVGGPYGILSTPHTSTDMGIGGNPFALGANAARASNVRALVNGTWVWPGSFTMINAEPLCWRIGPFSLAGFTNNFRFGGMGRGGFCL